MTSCDCAATSRPTMLLRADSSDTVSPRRQRASPGMASGPKWPWPGVRSKKEVEYGEYRRCGPMMHMPLFIEPCECKKTSNLKKKKRNGRALWNWKKRRKERGSCIAAAYVCDKLHVLGGANVLAKVDLVEGKRLLVQIEANLAAREAAVGLRRAGALGHLPREEALGDRDDLVARADFHLRVRAQEGEHRAVVGVQVVGHGEAVLDGTPDKLRIHGLRQHLAVVAKELGVAARNVAVAHDVAQDEDVLRLGDDRLGVAAGQKGMDNA